MEKDLLDLDDVSAELVELEDRSRRNNLRVDGFQEPQMRHGKHVRSRLAKF